VTYSRVNFTFLLVPILYVSHAGLPINFSKLPPKRSPPSFISILRIILQLSEKIKIIFLLHHYHSTLPTSLHLSFCSALSCLQPIFTRRTSGHFPGTFRVVGFLFHSPVIINVLPLTTRRILLLLFCPSHFRGIWNGNRILHISCENCCHWTLLSVAYYFCFVLARYRLQTSAQNQSGLKNIFIFPF